MEGLNLSGISCIPTYLLIHWIKVEVITSNTDFDLVLLIIFKSDCLANLTSHMVGFHGQMLFGIVHIDSVYVHFLLDGFFSFIYLLRADLDQDTPFESSGIVWVFIH